MPQPGGREGGTPHLLRARRTAPQWSRWGGRRPLACRLARAIPPALAPDVVRQIDARLDGVESDHGVRVPWAIESGGRAWGFPSPDSDYDARFLYVHPLTDYVGLRRRRDVIETPLDRVFDANGWDVRKALALMVRGNATVGEWLRSPIVYRGDQQVASGLLALADEAVDRAGLSGTTGTWRAATWRWSRAAAGSRSSSTPCVRRCACAGCGCTRTSPCRRWTSRQSSRARTREVGHAPVPGVLQALVAEELALAEVEQARLESAGGTGDRDVARDRADAFPPDLLGLRESAASR